MRPALQTGAGVSAPQGGGDQKSSLFRVYAALALPNGLRSSHWYLLCLADPRYVARDRLCDHLLAICVYLPPARKRPEDRVEREWLQNICHALNLGGGERD